MNDIKRMQIWFADLGVHDGKCLQEGDRTDRGHQSTSRPREVRYEGLSAEDRCSRRRGHRPHL